MNNKISNSSDSQIDKYSTIINYDHIIASLDITIDNLNEIPTIRNKNQNTISTLTKLKNDFITIRNSITND